MPMSNPGRLTGMSDDGTGIGVGLGVRVGSGVRVGVGELVGVGVGVAVGVAVGVGEGIGVLVGVGVGVGVKVGVGVGIVSGSGVASELSPSTDGNVGEGARGAVLALDDASSISKKGAPPTHSWAQVAAGRSTK
jgi:hypothetical protein